MLDRSDEVEAKWAKIFDSATDEAKALELEFYKDKDKLNTVFPKNFFKLVGSCETLKDDPAKLLRDFLQLAAKYDFNFRLDDGFERSLTACRIRQINETIRKEQLVVLR